MNVRTLLDTGPLVALLKEDDAHHAWAVEAFASRPLRDAVTCEAVLSEASFLLARWHKAIDALFDSVAAGLIQLAPLDDEGVPIHTLMKKYRNVPASYADACLVRLSERFRHAPLVTTDTDFRIYRRKGRERIPLIAPFS